MTDMSNLLKVESEFHPLLFQVSSQAFESALMGWIESGLASRVVRGSKMRRLADLFDEFAAALQFPLYFGENKDAFDECIAELERLPPGEGYVVAVTEPDQVLVDEHPGEFHWLAGSLKSAAEGWARPIELGEWWDRKEVPFHVVLVGENEVIDATNSRWSAVGIVPVRW